MADRRDDVGMPLSNVQCVGPMLAKQRQFFEEALPESVEIGAGVDGDGQRDVRRKEPRRLGRDPFELFMPEGDGELGPGADPREIGKESGEQRVARRGFEASQESCRRRDLLHSRARLGSFSCTASGEGDLDRLQVGQVAQPEILVLADARSELAQGSPPVDTERVECAAFFQAVKWKAR